MNKKKTIIATIVLLLIFAIGGAVAYFTDTTEVTTNTFTLGNVQIELSEPNWNANNAKDLMPGMEVDKDPTITNTGSNPAYVFMKVEVPCTTGTGAKEIFEYTPNTSWAELTSEAVACTDGKATKVYVYGTASAPTELAKAAATPALFSKVTVTELTGDEEGLTGNLNMDIKGYAIQSQGIESPTSSGLWDEVKAL